MACAHVLEIDSGKSRRKKTTANTLSGKTPRIVLADDQQQVLQIVASLVQDECEIVGLAPNGEQVLQLAKTKSPDLLILDISMGALSGFDVVLRLKDSAALTNIIFLTVHEDPDFVSAAVSLGVLGYVSKSHLITELMPAIRSVLNHRLYVSPSLHYSLPECQASLERMADKSALTNGSRRAPLDGNRQSQRRTHVDTGSNDSYL